MGGGMALLFAENGVKVLLQDPSGMYLRLLDAALTSAHAIKELSPEPAQETCLAVQHLVEAGNADSSG